MKTFRITTIIMGILLVVGCAPTAEQPTATVQVVPTDTITPGKRPSNVSLIRMFAATV
mgnify:CR=1 FL=1